MSVYSCLAASPRSWDAVLTASPAKTFKFDIMSVASDASELRIRNTDGTTTVLEGRDLATSAKVVADGSGETGVSGTLTGGTITRLARLAPDGSVLEELTGLSIVAAGPSKISSFGRPSGSLSSLAWALEGADGAENARRVGAGSQPSLPPVVPATTVRHIPPSLETLNVTTTTIDACKPKGVINPAHAPFFVFGAAILVGFIAVFLAWKTEESAGLDLEKMRFARPTSIPTPSDNAMTPARVVLGRRLFSEKMLSANGKVSCASCHDPERAFSQEASFGTGVTAKPLRRHTQTLWNVAWGRAFFWDGRAATLEAQARGPLEDPDEMGQKLEVGMAKLVSDPSYVTAFGAAYPEATTLTPDLILKALATFERSLVSPPTRFDRWIAGAPNALTPQERDGFGLFTGKAGCSSCHSGWAFTDHGFHDIGLPHSGKTIDKGRGFVLALDTLDNAFKTPSLRELKWTAPYMHDGSLATLNDVLRHYDGGVVERPTLSRDVPRGLHLTVPEREALLAFLGSLSSDGIPKPRGDIEIARERNITTTRSAPSMLKTIGQKDKRFAPENVRIALGEALFIVNNDSRPHNVSIAHPRMGYSSGLQEPGDQVKIPFPEAGQFDIFCGIHPNMRLQVEVRAPAVNN